MLLTEFLLRAIDQDEALALAAVPDQGRGRPTTALTPAWDSYLRAAGGPENLAAECEAKRHIVAAHVLGEGSRDLPAPGCRRCRADDETTTTWDRRGSCETLRLMAVGYADRPGYNPWWEPAWLRRAMAV
jgi:uncharacterized protein DUF6221